MVDPFALVAEFGGDPGGFAGAVGVLTDLAHPSSELGLDGLAGSPCSRGAAPVEEARARHLPATSTAARRRTGAGDRQRTGSGSPARPPCGGCHALPLRLTDPLAHRGRLRLNVVTAIPGSGRRSGAGTGRQRPLAARNQFPSGRCPPPPRSPTTDLSRSRPRPVQHDRARRELGRAVPHPHGDSVLPDHQYPSPSDAQNPKSRPHYLDDTTPTASATTHADRMAGATPACTGGSYAGTACIYGPGAVFDGCGWNPLTSSQAGFAASSSMLKPC